MKPSGSRFSLNCFRRCPGLAVSGSPGNGPPLHINPMYPLPQLYHFYHYAIPIDSSRNACGKSNRSPFMLLVAYRRYWSRPRGADAVMVQTTSFTGLPQSLPRRLITTFWTPMLTAGTRRSRPVATPAGIKATSDIHHERKYNITLPTLKIRNVIRVYDFLSLDVCSE